MNPAPLAPRSGRWTVAAIVLVVLVGWFGLGQAFRAWTARYQARARFGAEQVAPSIDPLVRSVPSGVDPATWRAAVADTHAMLVALTAASVLDEGQMEALRRHLVGEVERATRQPATAQATLARIWDDLERDAGPTIAPDLVPPPPNSRHALRHPRPARPGLLGPSRTLR